ncbi:MAG TPA: amidohydrolase family protein [Rectinemataceae bacterium]|nr:amidohydrolase family protein [Rectinemataceae bacterium]
MATRFFFDAHCHVLELSHPNFLDFVEGLRHRGLETIYQGLSAPNFIMTSFFSKGGERLRNLLAVMGRQAGEIFELMEDDLLGLYAARHGGEALVRDGILRVGDLEFDRAMVVPLVMDFAAAPKDNPAIWYDRQPPKEVTRQLRDLLEGIAHYRRSRPEGFLDIRPFLGVNTALHDRGTLAALLGAAFEGYQSGLEAATRASRAMAAWDGSWKANVFAGVKLYPPLGFDPFPPGGIEREKTDYLFGFCEERGIPIVTHCDDMGFRDLPLEEAWRYSSPERWSPRLRANPRLRIDFAHFGMQYSFRLGQGPRNEWTEAIVDLMREYEGVYADIAFNGCDPMYYDQLFSLIAREERRSGELLSDRLLFGSDFAINLLKIRSWSEYIGIFSKSCLPDRLKERMCSINPVSFLFGE